MYKKEAIQAMLDGKKVKHIGDRRYWEYLDNAFYYNGTLRGIIGMYSDGYKIYKPPKQKVKVWQWVIQIDPDSPRLTIHFYPNREAVESTVVGEILQRADWTEIEVEVEDES